jgi:hypothetical protein
LLNRGRVRSGKYFINMCNNGLNVSGTVLGHVLPLRFEVFPEITTRVSLTPLEPG